MYQKPQHSHYMQPCKINYMYCKIFKLLLVPIMIQSELLNKCLQGGKSPAIVWKDVDIDEAVEQCHNAIMYNTGAAARAQQLQPTQHLPACSNPMMAVNVDICHPDEGYDVMMWPVLYAANRFRQGVLMYAGQVCSAASRTLVHKVRQMVECRTAPSQAPFMVVPCNMPEPAVPLTSAVTVRRTYKTRSMCMRTGHLRRVCGKVRGACEVSKGGRPAGRDDPAGSPGQLLLLQTPLHAC